MAGQALPNQDKLHASTYYWLGTGYRGTYSVCDWRSNVVRAEERREPLNLIRNRERIRLPDKADRLCGQALTKPVLFSSKYVILVASKVFWICSTSLLQDEG